MKRRDLLKSVAGLSAAVSAPDPLFSQQPSRQAEGGTSEAPGEETAALPVTLGDEVGRPVSVFFAPAEIATFQRLAEVLVPRTRTPGAVEAGAPEFLGFYLARSGPERQKLYRDGLARLNSEAQRQFQKPFAELAASDVDKLLAPLREPWRPVPSPDLLTAFLRAAKDDLWRATVNSRVWALASEGRRRSTGGTYWYPVE